MRCLGLYSLHQLDAVQHAGNINLNTVAQEHTPNGISVKALRQGAKYSTKCLRLFSFSRGGQV